jgi:hypothetical protein
MLSTMNLISATSAFVLCGMLAAQPTPQTRKEQIQTGAASATETASGTLLSVNDNTLVVRLTNGNVRMFTPPPSLRYLIDGKELTINELKPGTKLNAAVTTTHTSITDRTTTVGEGTVWYVSGPNVILTLPNGENRQYKVKDDYKFNVEGRPATVFDLRKGMKVKAEKIVEEPRVVLSTDRRVTGTAPPALVAKASPVPASDPTPTPAPRAAPRPAPVESAAAQTPTPAPASEEPLPKKLPSTAGHLSAVGLLGLLCGASALFVRRIRS